MNLKQYLHSKLSRFNTLRNQILVFFIIVMVFVLVFVEWITFFQISALLKNNAEKQMQQTVVQANGRLETLYRQINTLTRQVTTDAEVQQLLLDEVRGEKADFVERQSLMQIASAYQVYSSGIHAMELYAKDGRRLFPLDQGELSDRVDTKWIQRADREKGRLVWIGKDPQDPNFFLAVRRISLMDRWFSNGGYLLVQINKDYFQLNAEPSSDEENTYRILVDEQHNPISSNYDGDIEAILKHEQPTITIQDKDYIAVQRHSNLTGWTLIILTPVSTLTKGIAAIRTLILLIGLAGFFIFFVFSFFSRR